MTKIEKMPVFDMEAPLVQAVRCLELWLAEEKLSLDPRRKKRVAALIARYFYNEDILTDQLILSFLRHYSGWHEVDLEDVGAVRHEIKRVLDETIPVSGPIPGSVSAVGAREEGRGTMFFYIVALALGAAMIFAGVGLSGTNALVTRGEQEQLRILVDQVIDLEKQKHGVEISHQKLWAEIKKPLTVRSYQDMTHKDYKESRQRLEQKLRELAGHPS